jgi:hypothetical protein
MKATNILIFAFVGLCCIVDVKPQGTPTAAQQSDQNEPTGTYGFRDSFPNDVPKAAVDVFETIYKLQEDYTQMKNNSKYDGVLIKNDIQAIVKVADANGIVIPAQTKTKVDAFLVSLDKMVSDKKFKPKIVRAGVFGVVRLLKPDANGFQKFPEMIPTARPTITASILRMNICAEFCY